MFHVDENINEPMKSKINFGEPFWREILLNGKKVSKHEIENSIIDNFELSYKDFILINTRLDTI